MKKKHILYATIKEDKSGFQWEKPFDLKNLPGKLDKYGRLKITFEKYVPLKSNKQLGYYHSGILPYLEKELYTATGLTRDDWHLELKTRFGIKEVDRSGEFTINRSHKLYSEKEMAFFITQTINWCREFFNIELPPPTVIEEYI